MSSSNSLESFVENSWEFSENLVGIRPNGDLTLYESSDWGSFVSSNQLPKQIHGVYDGHNNHSHIWLDGPFMPSILVHEYVGHSIYAQHSSKVPLITQEHDAEGFSLWMESKAHAKLGYTDIFTQRYNAMSGVEKDLLKMFCEYETRFSTNHLLKSLGL